METRMDEVCEEVRNTASNIAELLEIVKRNAECSSHRGCGEPMPGLEMLEKTDIGGKFSSYTPLFCCNTADCMSSTPLYVHHSYVGS